MITAAVGNWFSKFGTLKDLRQDRCTPLMLMKCIPAMLPFCSRTISFVFHARSRFLCLIQQPSKTKIQFINQGENSRWMWLMKTPWFHSTSSWESANNKILSLFITFGNKSQNTITKLLFLLIPAPSLQPGWVVRRAAVKPHSSPSSKVSGLEDIFDKV